MRIKYWTLAISVIAAWGFAVASAAHTPTMKITADGACVAIVYESRTTDCTVKPDRYETSYVSYDYAAHAE